jgi:hypothetical protein
MTSLAGVNADIRFWLLEIRPGIIELCGDMFDGFMPNSFLAQARRGSREFPGAEITQ